jgi:prepilin-type processing-associated H-X9-DG protein
VYGFHSGGANVVYADGSVHFLAETMDLRVLAALATRAGGEVFQAP